MTSSKASALPRPQFLTSKTGKLRVDEELIPGAEPLYAELGLALVIHIHQARRLFESQGSPDLPSMPSPLLPVPLHAPWAAS